MTDTRTSPAGSAAYQSYKEAVHMLRVTVKTFAAFAIITVCLAAYAKEPIWQSATVISQDIRDYNNGAAAMPIGTMIVGVPITRRANIVVIETATHRLTWSESGNKTIILPVNDVVRFYQDKNWFVVLDANGKKHKFALIHVEAKSKKESN